MKTNNLKWIVFDIDDTLWDFKNNSLISLKLLYKKHKILQDKFSNINDFIKLYHEINHHLWNDYNCGKISTDELKIRRFSELMYSQSDYKILVNSKLDTCKNLNRDYLNILGNQTKLAEGAIETLSALQKQYLIGALTNGFNNVQYKKIYNTGLWKYIQRMIISDETPWHKPEIELFRYAEIVFGAKPNEILLIGDNPATDIRGAKNAGWETLWFSAEAESDIKYLKEISMFLKKK